MVIILNLFPQQLLLPIDKRLRSVIGLRVVECLMDRELLGFSALFLLSFGLVQGKILRLFFNVEVLDSPASPVDIDHLQVSVCHEEQLPYFLALVDEHLPIGQNVLFKGRHEGSDHHLGSLLEDGRLHECIQLLLKVVLCRIRNELAVESVGDLDDVASMRRSVHFSVV